MKNVRKQFRKIPYLVLLMLFCVVAAYSQSGITLKGTVTDTHGEPVIGASVSVKGDPTKGTMTDVDGAFSLSVANDKATLVVTYIGMTTKEVRIAGSRTFKIVLEEDNKILNEVIVVGFGQQKKQSVVGAISQASGKVLERTGGVSSLGSALTGNIPGLITTTTTGMPGEENPNLVIRAQTTWNNSAPLILVDGIERPMSDVDINSVESISVLKDASATAVFGVKGANGVILITTKRGQDGKARIDIGANMTLKSVSKLPNKYDVYDALMLKNKIVEYELAATGSSGSWAYINPQEYIENFRNQTTQEQRERYPNIDWSDYLFKDFAMSYNANINISGGTKFVKYFSSVDYTHEGDLFKSFNSGKGYDPKFTYDRLNTRTNLDFQLTKSTVFKVNLFGSYGVRTSPGGVNVDGVSDYMAGAYSMPGDAFYPQYSDGSWGFYYPERSGVVTQNSARIFANAGVLKRTDTRFSTDFTVNQDLGFLLRGLNLQASLSWDNRFREESRGIRESSDGAVRVKWIDPKTGIVYTDPDQGINPNTGYDWVPVIAWVAQGGTINANNTYRGLNYNVQANYATTLAEKHNVSLMGNFMRQENSTGNQIPYYREDWVFRSTYNFDNRYFIEYNGAYNGSERFAKKYRFGFFSSGAVGWMLSEEKFMKKFKFLDMLKLRASYGKIGDDSNGRFIYLDQWAYSNNAELGTMPGAGLSSPYTWYRQTQVGNPEIRWETVTKKNYGIDYSILGGLFSGTVEIFNDLREDILLSGTSRAVPSYFGVTPPIANLGRVKGKGYEIEVRFNKVLSNKMRFWANASMTHSENVILDADDPSLSPDYTKKAGYTNGQATSYITNGYYNTMDELYGSTPFVTNDTKIPGSYNIVDYDGDGVIDSDRVPYGFSGNPQNTYNTSIGWEWKGFSIFAQFYGVRNVTRNVTLTSFNRPFLNTAYDVGSYWSIDNTNADSPLPRLVSNINGNYLGDKFMYDGSFIRLKNAEASYTFNSGWIKKFGMSSLRIYLNGNNLWMWSRMPDDRESSMSGGVWVGTAYPTVKRYNLGIKITL